MLHYHATYKHTWLWQIRKVNMRFTFLHEQMPYRGTSVSHEASSSASCSSESMHYKL